MKFRILVVCASFWIAVSGAAQAVPISGQGSWESTLQGRDLDGNLTTFEAYYDATLDITWLADANYAKTSGFHTSGNMGWGAANLWVAGLNPYGSGITGWRLPNTIDTGPLNCDAFAFSGTDCGYNVDTTTGEMASMFYDTLGNLALFDTNGNQPQSGWGLTNTGLFANLQPNHYWSALEVSQSGLPTAAWEFNFNNGRQGTFVKTHNFFAWAVHDGNVGTSLVAVPEPTTLWLLGSGLLGLIGVRTGGRRHKSSS